MQPTRFDESHVIFRDAVRRFAEEKLAPHADEWERDRIFPRSVFEEMGKLGFLGARYPEELGGAGGDIWHSIVLAEELPRCDMAGLTMGVLVHTNMATPIIHELGSEEQKALFLTPALAGEKIAALGITEPGAGSDVVALRTRARRDGDELVINGQKTFITNGSRADFITLAVRTDPEDRYGGLSLVLFPTDTPGFSVGRTVEKIGNHSSDTAALFFEDCRIPRRFVLGEEGLGFRYIMQNFEEERLIAAAMGVASAQLTLERTIAYGKERQIFGRPVTAFQVNAHKIVDMMTQLEAARQLTYHAADRYHAGVPATREITMAKLMVGELAMRIADTCLQLHGGAGYTEELTVARAWRDARLLSIGGGTSEVMREILRKLSGI